MGILRRLVADQVTILGASGALGFGLALRLGQAGVAVVVGSRDAERAPRDRASGSPSACPTAASTATPTGRPRSARRSSLVCVPFRNQSETYTNLKEHLREGQLVVDATVPLAAAVSGRATRMLGVWQGSAAQQAAEMVPDGVRVVVRAAHRLARPTLSDLDAPLDEDVLVCGDRRADKRAVAALIARVAGPAPVDCGRLEQARIAESLTALLIGVNARYKTHAGVRITGLPDELWPEK